MSLTLRRGTASDAQACGEICYHAFAAIARQHNFPPDLPSAEVGVGLVAALLSRPDVYSVVAESEGRVLGSNFLWESTRIAGVGPITVDPDSQNSAVGRALMLDVMARLHAFGRVPTDLLGCEIAGLHTPLSGHCRLPRFSPNPQLPIIPTWQSEKSKRMGSPGSSCRSVRVMSAAIRQPALV